MRHKRRIKLIRPRLQLRLVSIFAGIGVLSLLLQCLLFYQVLGRLAIGLPNDGLIVLDAVNGSIAAILISSLCMLLPAIFWIGIQVTFRIAGPVYRLETYLRQVANGERPPDCKLRRGDQLQELCEAVNAATRPLRLSEPSPAVHAPVKGASHKDAA
jgi:hypothetical protein